MTTEPETWTGRTVDFDRFKQDLARRIAEVGPGAMPRNDGTRRTASKRALLKAIEEAGGRW